MKTNLVQNENAAKEILRAVKYMIDEAMTNTTKIYDGIVVGVSNDYYEVLINGKKNIIKGNSRYSFLINDNVKVIVPQGNMNTAFII